MPQMRSAAPTIRTICAALLALILAVRMLSPAGFMPAFDHGAVTIVACPDYEPAAAPMAHHHGHQGAKHDHQPCPYAAAAGAGTASDLFAFAAVLFFAAALLFSPNYDFSETRRRHERPPLRGPPVTA